MPRVVKVIQPKSKLGESCRRAHVCQASVLGRLRQIREIGSLDRVGSKSALKTQQLENNSVTDKEDKVKSVEIALDRKYFALYQIEGEHGFSIRGLIASSVSRIFCDKIHSGRFIARNAVARPTVSEFRVSDPHSR